MSPKLPSAHRQTIFISYKIAIFGGELRGFGTTLFRTKASADPALNPAIFGIEERGRRGAGQGYSQWPACQQVASERYGACIQPTPRKQIKKIRDIFISWNVGIVPGNQGPKSPANRPRRQQLEGQIVSVFFRTTQHLQTCYCLRSLPSAPSPFNQSVLGAGESERTKREKKNLDPFWVPVVAPFPCS